MCKPNTKCTHDGGVRQISLHARDRQLARKMLKRRIGEPKISLRVLKVDRVHLVRHGRRPHFTLHCSLLEEAPRDVRPHVAIVVQENRVEPANGMRQLRHAVMRLNLRRVRVPRQAQRSLDHVCDHRRPVHTRIGHTVSIEVADSSIRLARDWNVGNAAALAVKPVCDVGDFLAHRRWRSRLTVRECKHGHVGQPFGHGSKNINKFGHRGQQHLLATLLEHQRVCQVVHILAGASKVHKLSQRRQLRKGCHLVLDKVLDRLDIVVGHSLVCLHLARILLAKPIDDRLKILCSI
mmetsp:Transcript_1380/g.4072  ORF Transcript_1380/g.4072 Transcript_1380/m.4072 type:complete len:293 (+) Transcript_1380:390-1268(+)